MSCRRKLLGANDSSDDLHATSGQSHPDAESPREIVGPKHIEQQAAAECPKDDGQGEVG